MEKTEHADLWLDVMTTSGVEALFGLLTQSSPLQHAVLLAIKNLATHPKMAQLLLDYGLADIMQLTACKVRNLCSFLIIFSHTFFNA